MDPNQLAVDDLVQFLRNKFPQYIFTADTPCVLEFYKKPLWVEINIDVLGSSLINSHLRLVIKRKTGIAEASCHGECLNGCFPSSGSNDLTAAAEEWMIEDQRAKPVEWKESLTLKYDIPLFDAVANDLHDFAESIIFCAREFSPHFQFVGHSAGHPVTYQNIDYWSKLRATIRYKHEIEFSVEITRSEDNLCVTQIDVIQFQFMHLWQYLKFGNNSFLKAIFLAAQTWERATSSSTRTRGYHSSRIENGLLLKILSPIKTIKFSMCFVPL